MATLADKQAGSHTPSPQHSPNRSLSASPSDNVNLETFGHLSSDQRGTFENGAFVTAANDINGRLPAQDQGVPLRTGMVRALSAPEPQQLLRQASSRACMAIAEEAGETSTTSGGSVLQPALASPSVEVKTLNLNSEAAPFTPKRTMQPLPETPAAGLSPDKTPFMQDLLDRLIRVELSIFPLRELSSRVNTLRQDVDFLLRAQRQGGGGGLAASSSQSPTPSAVSNASPVINGAALPPSDELQHLSSQVNGLTSAVSHLMQAQQTQQPAQQSPVALSPAQMYGASGPVRSSPSTARSASPVTTFSSHPRWSAGLDKSSRMSSATSYMGLPVMEASTSANQSKWMPLGPLLTHSLHRTLLALPGLAAPTKIQLKAIPCLLSSQEDIVAQTTGDTESILSYGLPAIQLCSDSPSASGGVTCLIVCATVDRASQAQRMLHHLGSAQGIRTAVAVSRSASEDASLIARMRPQILLATPQSALDLLAMRIVGSEGSIRLLVLDEADSLMYTGQHEPVQNIVRLLPPSQVAQTYDPWADTSATPSSNEKTLGRQTAIFGGTIPQELLDFASKLQLREPVRVLVRKGGTPATPSSSHVNQSLSSPAELSLKGARHFYLYVALSSDRAWKLEAVSDLLMDASTPQAIVFCGSLEAVEAVSFKLASHNIDALAIHDDMGAAARSSVITKFRSPSISGAKKALVVCDRLCRTIPELQQVPLIANFDLPITCESYVHHCSPALASGYGRPGAVINIITTEADIQHLQRIESFCGVRMLQMPADAASIA